MGRKMNRGKQQVLFNYLPGRTFDFEGGVISRVSQIRGLQRNDLNIRMLLIKIQEEARGWDEQFRPGLPDRILDDASKFILLEPKNVDAELFPKVFWCDNRICGRVFDYSNRDNLPQQATCSVCRTGKLLQLRFVKIHQCGALESLSPPLCQQCRSPNHMALDTRGSERISNFRWVCRNSQCNGRKASLYPGLCRVCHQPSNTQQPNNTQPTNRRESEMSIEVHRAGRTYYGQTTTLLNIPRRQLDAFFNLPDWGAIAAAKFFGITNRPLEDFNLSAANQQINPSASYSDADLDALMSPNKSPEQIVAEIQALRQQRQQEQQQHAPDAIAQQLITQTGVPLTTWRQVGQEILETIMPLENGRPKKLFELPPTTQEIQNAQVAQQTAQSMGLAQLDLVTDFPMIVATYGYTRAETTPNQCRLNPFPPERDHGGKLPIYVDKVQADALLISLNPDRVHSWLQRNGYQPTMPNGSDPNIARRAYFVQLFEDVPLRETLQGDSPEARMVFGLLHTLSHLCVRQAALLCGLDRTSLSEYLLPRTLTFAIYCNHRFGATIGALTALFEQSLAEWLNAVRNARRCVYDPVCRERESSCHACTHLAETSCRFFNLNLGRSFLFGGQDRSLDKNLIGYLDPSL
ncbi:hypothetical protein [Altericista sp. CCNU0014]|uniref:hypothetical protein n=1 Tax=Altericista sp. CCNU0014 TaxID=3082949 RepID=UPI003850B110